MWPFGKKGRKAPASTWASMSVDERTDWQQRHHFALEGPFPVSDEQGMLLCKNCGTPFDTMTREGGIRVIMETVLSANDRMASCMINCRKCKTVNAFSPRELLLEDSENPFQDWTAEEVRKGIAEIRARLGPEQNSAIADGTIETALACEPGRGPGMAQAYVEHVERAGLAG